MENERSMKWLEGWFGTASGVMGALFVAAVSLLTPAYAVSESCVSVDGGPQTCTSSQQNIGPQPGLLILAIVLLILFILIIVGTWLDLSDRRTAGRLILLISVTLMLPIWIVGGAALAHTGAALAFTYPIALLGFVAGILACVRRDTPRAGGAGATPAQS